MLLLLILAILFGTFEVGPVIGPPGLGRPAASNERTDEKPAVLSAPPVPGLVVDGVQVPGIAMNALVGNVSVITVFASWCGPCQDQREQVRRLTADDRFLVFGLMYRDDAGIDFIGPDASAFDGVGLDETGAAGIALGVYGAPETFVLDRTGAVRYQLLGPITPERFDELFMPQIEAVLSERPAGTQPAPAATPPA